MLYHIHLLISLTLTPLLLATSTLAAAPRPPAAILSSYAFSGTGCPSSSSFAFLSPSFESISMDFGGNYQASLGPGIPVVENRRNCQMSFNISTPTNSRWRLCYGSANLKGTVSLEANVTAAFKNIYYFPSMETQTTASLNWEGPKEGAFSARVDSDMGCESYSPCGNEAQFNVNSQLILRSTVAGKTGSLEIGGEFTGGMEVGLLWDYC